MFEYTSVENLIEEVLQSNKTISEFVLRDQSIQMEISPEDLFLRMTEHLDVMLDSVEKGSKPGVRSASGLTGGDAYKMKTYIGKGNSLCGSLMTKAMQNALAVSEINAAMGKIVASPTAGSCGILPSALATMIEEKNIPKEKAIMSLFTSGAIGLIIANKASISGAEGGCQAECGSASAMAAAAIVELCGGSPSMIKHAVAISLKCVLGLVCDPVAGLVEVPCIKRNVTGVTLSFTAAEMALAGIESVIPVDEVILSVKAVGDAMPSSLKETAEGGLAATSTGQNLEAQIFGPKKTKILQSCYGCTSCG